jgi:transposase
LWSKKCAQIILCKEKHYTGEKEPKEIEYDKEKYKKLGLTERIFGTLKENRRLAVRYEKSDINFLGFIVIAFLKLVLC